MYRFIILASTFAVLYFPIKIQAQWSAAPQIVISIPRSDFANVSGTGGGFGVKVSVISGDAAVLDYAETLLF